MGMQTGGGGELNSEINVTPLVDVMLVLLVIFMITAPMMNTGVDINLPTAPGEKFVDAEDAKNILSIGKGYGLKISGADVTWKELGKKIKNNKKIQDEGALWLEADQDLPYGVVIRAMAIVQNSSVKKNGAIKIKMLTRPSQDLKIEELDRKVAGSSK